MTETINGIDRNIDREKAVKNVLLLAAELKTESFADVQPWMIARLIYVAVADDMAAGFGDTATPTEETTP